jgi:hypothetical protein
MQPFDHPAHTAATARKLIRLKMPEEEEEEAPVLRPRKRARVVEDESAEDESSEGTLTSESLGESDTDVAAAEGSMSGDESDEDFVDD